MSTHRLPRRVPTGLVGALIAAIGLAAATPASAAVGSQAFSTAGEHAFVVPAGVTSVHVRLVGGSGGTGYNAFVAYIEPGGAGGVATATIAVAPGQTLFAEVAANGGPGNASYPGQGAPGGGAGGYREGPGGGGGASQLRRCSVNDSSPTFCGASKLLSSRLVVAGGGGGGGGDSDTPYLYGGAGGAAGTAGGDGLDDSTGDAPGQGGQPGGQSAGGAGGAISEPLAPSSHGQLGAGGNGGGSEAGGGGGGGGGLYGGGGGGGGEVAGGHGSGGGGGGGSSGVPGGTAGVSGFSAFAAPLGTAPSATFSWTLPPPTVTTGPAAGVSRTAATLHGVVNPNGSAVTDCYFELAHVGQRGARVPCNEQVGAGSVPVAVSATPVGLAAGVAYTATLVATTAQGTHAGRTVKFVTVGGAPRLTRLRQSAARWRIGTRLPVRAAAARRTPIGTRFSFTLSESASVRLRFRHVTAGRRTRAISARVLKLHAHRGANIVRFDGVLPPTTRLAAGRYIVTFTATAASGRKSRARSLAFTIVRR